MPEQELSTLAAILSWVPFLVMLAGFAYVGRKLARLEKTLRTTNRLLGRLVEERSPSRDPS